jgi:hypothetical protein
VSTLPPPADLAPVEPGFSLAEDVGQRAARQARGLLEEALLGLVTIAAPIEREGLRDRLLRAIHCTYLAEEAKVVAAAQLDGLREAATMAAEVRTLLARAGDPSELPSLAAALASLAEAEARLAEGADAVAQIQMVRRAELLLGPVTSAVPPPRPFRVSRGLPSLHAIARLPLLPWVDVGEDPAPSPKPTKLTLEAPRSLAELGALAEQAASGALAERLAAAADEAEKGEPDERAAEALPPLAFLPAVEEVELLRRLGRDCLEDIACHRSLRKPNAIESWLDQGPFEQRLLRNVDAFAALGAAALPQVSLYHAEAKTPDPERAFAVALTLGCIDGADAIGAAVLSLKQSAPETFPGWVEGFWLAPSPAIDRAMADLCESRRPELVALALDVLHLRAQTPASVVRALLPRTEPPIAARVARALATALPDAEAARALTAALAAPDDELFFAALESAFRRGHELALPTLREAALPGSPRAARALPLLCLAGRASDAAAISAALVTAPTPALARAAGRFGHVDLLPRLLDLLHGDDPELAAASAEALERITGAGLRETVEEPWDIELPPEAEGAGGLPIPLRKVERVVRDPAAWAAWLAEHEEALDPRQKTRAGRPFTPAQIVDELEARATPPERRDEALRELLLLTGAETPFSPADWVERQQHHLAELRVQVAAIPFSSGAWSRVPRARPTPDEPEPSVSPPAVRPHTERPPAPVGSTTKPIVPLPAQRPVLPFAPVQAPTEAPSVAPSERPDLPEVLPFVKVRGAEAAGEASKPAVAPPPPPAVAPPPPPAVAPPAPPPSVSVEAAPPSTTGAGPATLRLSLDRYAALCAELSVFPDRAELVFGRYGLADRRHRLEVDLGWQAQLRHYPALFAQWQALYQRWCAHFAAQARGGGAGEGAPEGS